MNAHAVADDGRLRFRRSCVVAFLLVTAACQGDPAHAAPKAVICGDATGDGTIRSGDALASLKVAVGVGQCVPPRCDVNQSGSINTSDAMLILGRAVGRQIVLSCPTAPSSTTTTTTTSTTSTSLSASCGNGVVEPGEDCEVGFCRGSCNVVTNLCVDIMCSPDCTCPEPECGDSVLDPGEDCDPPGSACIGGTCSAGCVCVP